MIGLLLINLEQPLYFAQTPGATPLPNQGQPTVSPAPQSLPANPPAQNTQSQSVPSTPVLGGEPVQTIYVIPMRNKMEFYLAREITKWGRFQVTLNPKNADALLADSPNLKVQDILQSAATGIRPTGISPGTIFLISSRREKILWATNEKTTSLNPLAGTKTIEKLAEGIIGKLRHDVNEWDKKIMKEEAAGPKP
jgi:hypothetical protein